MATAAALSACAAPGHDALRVVQAGQVAPTAAPAFADCITDAWQGNQNALSKVRIEQQRRADGVRVNVLAYSILVDSADVADSGHVEMRTATTDMGSVGERKAFAACLARYAST